MDQKICTICIKEFVVERNAYFAHPENIMLAMLADENEEIRNAAVKKIVFLRNKASEGAQSTNIPHFKVQKSIQRLSLIMNWQILMRVMSKNHHYFVISPFQTWKT